MDGYTKQAIKNSIIEQGGNPDLPPSQMERSFFKFWVPIFGVVF